MTDVTAALEEIISKAPESVREAFIERSAAFEAGGLVRAMRERAKFTQKQLAEKISTSQSHLSEVERGNGLQGPTFSMLRKVANACAADLRIDFGPRTFGDIAAANRDALAEGFGVTPASVPQALLDYRERALTILSANSLEKIVRGRAELAYKYALWLAGMPDISE
jgi:transcriptional regulator with XRE-family HTH domain